MVCTPLLKTVWKPRTSSDGDGRAGGAQGRADPGVAAEIRCEEGVAGELIEGAGGLLAVDIGVLQGIVR